MTMNTANPIITPTPITQGNLYGISFEHYALAVIAFALVFALIFILYQYSA